MHREELRFETPGRGTQEITREVQRVIARSGIDAGMANVFVHHSGLVKIGDLGLSRGIDLEEETWCAARLTWGIIVWYYFLPLAEQ